jgi:cell division protein FtsW (lipid II flippase)
VLLISAAALLMVSLWTLAGAGPQAQWQRDWQRGLLIRQSVSGVTALLLAYGVGVLGLHRRLLKVWYVFPAALILLAIAAPASHLAGWGVMVRGTYWWQRSGGMIAFVLALVFTLGFVLPKLSRDERGGWSAMAGVLVLVAALAVAFRNDGSGLLVGFLVVGLACVPLLHGSRRLAVVGVVGLGLALSVAATVALRPVLTERLFDGPGAYQARQALLTIRQAGWFGASAPLPFLPEWHTSFMFARLCGAAGAVAAGFAALIFAGFLVVAAWQVVRRCQEGSQEKALAVACAAALAVPGFLHVGVCLSVLPTFDVHFPMLSYGPRLLLLDGFLVGLLISLGRGAPSEAALAPGGRSAASSGVGATLLWLVVAAAFALVGWDVVRQLRRPLPAVPVRGAIFDRCGKPLAWSDSVWRREGQREFRRHAGVPLSHLVGRVVHPTQQGLCGLEQRHDRALRKRVDLRVTLDLERQAACQELCEAAADETRARRVHVVAMQARSGAIRAAAQWPAVHAEDRLENNTFEPLGWQALIEVFEPGALMMPLVMGAALDAYVLQTNTLIDCGQGTWTYSGHVLRDTGSYGLTLPSEILRMPSTIGMAKIGLLMGDRRLQEALVRWDLTRPCGAGLGGACSGIHHSPEHWSSVSQTRLPIGYGCAVSLLQLLRAYAAFYNDDGRYAEPHLVEATRNSPATPWHPLSYPMLEVRWRPETLRWVRQVLTQVVDSGPASAARIPGVSIAGKTATVHKPFRDHSGYDTNKVQTAFIGGFMAVDGPMLIAVWLDEPERPPLENPAIPLFRKAACVFLAAP